MKVNLFCNRVLIIIISVIINNATFSQKHNVQYFASDSVEQNLLNQQKFITTFNNFQQAELYINQLKNWVQSKGFIAASIDSVVTNSNQTLLFIFLGKQYFYGIVFESKQQNIFKEFGFDKEFSKNKYFNFLEFYKSRNKIIDYYKNTGYPFASIWLDNIQIMNDTIKANMNLAKGSQYKFDSIRVFGNAKISKNFIHHYLNILPSSLYNESKLKKINQYISELPFLETIQSWDINMLNTGSIINLYLNNKKSNQISLIAGFLPTNQQIGGKLLFTVDANLLLQNAFASGETIGLIWQQIQPKSPKLNIRFQQPYLFNSNYGIDLSFDLFKRDSLFINLDFQAGISFQISTQQKGKIAFQNQSTSLINPDTLQVIISKTLPNIIDVSTSKLNASYEYNSTNFKWNPQKGEELKFNISLGKRAIKKNIAFTQIKNSSYNYGGLYDSLKLNSYQLKINAFFSKYFKIAKQSILKTGINLGWIQSPDLFKNELFQIGGNKLLRGFDDESIFSNLYVVTSAEYRILINNASYLFSFLDAGYSKYEVQKINFSNTYLGWGLGLAFETKSGYFNVSYAIGKRNDLPISLRQAKIHFGYVSTF